MADDHCSKCHGDQKIVEIETTLKDIRSGVNTIVELLSRLDRSNVRVDGKKDFSDLHDIVNFEKTPIGGNDNTSNRTFSPFLDEDGSLLECLSKEPSTVKRKLDVEHEKITETPAKVVDFESFSLGNMCLSTLMWILRTNILQRTIAECSTFVPYISTDLSFVFNEAERTWERSDVKRAPKKKDPQVADERRKDADVSEEEDIDHSIPKKLSDRRSTFESLVVQSMLKHLHPEVFTDEKMKEFQAVAKQIMKEKVFEDEKDEKDEDNLDVDRRPFGSEMPEGQDDELNEENATMNFNSGYNY